MYVILYLDNVTMALGRPKQPRVSRSKSSAEQEAPTAKARSIGMSILEVSLHELFCLRFFKSQNEKSREGV